MSVTMLRTMTTMVTAESTGPKVRALVYMA